MRRAWLVKSSLLFVGCVISASIPVKAQVSDAWQPIPKQDLLLKDTPANPGSSAMILEREVYTDDEKRLQREWVRIKIFGEEGVGADGRVLSKAEVVDGFRAGNIKFDSIETSDIKVQVYGDTAVVTDTSTIKGHRGDHDLSGQYRDIRVFVKRGGEWQSVLLQRTKVSP